MNTRKIIGIIVMVLLLLLCAVLMVLRVSAAKASDAAALRESGGAITIETDQVFRPADRGQGADRRALGLRIYRARLLTPAS